MSELSKFQKKALAAFTSRDTDIDIVVLYTRIYGDPGSLSVREMQMKIGPTFARLNTKLVGLTIEVGDTKRTYRATTLKKA